MSTRNKYGNKKAECDGHRFDSLAEMRRYQELKLLEAAGEITDLELQPEFELVPAFMVNGKKEQPIRYRADFRYLETSTGWRVVEDVKGAKTKEYQLKRKLLLYKFKGIVFREVEA